MVENCRHFHNKAFSNENVVQADVFSQVNSSKGSNFSYSSMKSRVIPNYSIPSISITLNNVKTVNFCRIGTDLNTTVHWAC